MDVDLATPIRRKFTKYIRPMILHVVLAGKRGEGGRMGGGGGVGGRRQGERSTKGS